MRWPPQPAQRPAVGGGATARRQVLCRVTRRLGTSASISEPLENLGPRQNSGYGTLSAPAQGEESLNLQPVAISSLARDLYVDRQLQEPRRKHSEFGPRSSAPWSAAPGRPRKRSRVIRTNA